MEGDELIELIARARSELPEIPESVWRRFEYLVREQAGGRRVYIRAQPKAARLERLAVLDGTRMTETARAEDMGISPRHLRRLRGLSR